MSLAQGSGLVTVAVALVAGGSALLGAWLTSRNAARSIRQNWELQQIEKWRQVRNDRLEELYYAIDHWYRGVRDIMLTHEAALTGHLARDAAISRMEVLHADPMLDISRVSQLLDVHADDLKVFFIDMLDARSTIQMYSRYWMKDESDVFPQMEGERRRIEQALKSARPRRWRTPRPPQSTSGIPPWRPVSDGLSHAKVTGGCIADGWGGAAAEG